MTIKSLIRRFVRQAPRNTLNVLLAHMCRQEYDNQVFDKFNERPVEFAFLFRHLARLYPKSILDVGTGTTALPHLMRNCGNLVTATDNLKDAYWPYGFSNRHYWIIDDDITDTQLQGEWDFVSCISVLEHIDQFDAAVRNLFQKTKIGGHVVLTFPYNEGTYSPNCYYLEHSAYGRDLPYVAQSYSRKQVDIWCRDNNAQIIEQEFWRFWTGELWTQGQQIIPPQQTTADRSHQLTCLLLQKK